MSEISKFNSLVQDGNLYYNKQQYEKSSRLYERAGQFAINNSLSKEKIKEVFWLAITSWISACKIDNIFRILK
ncbi:MAG TPA: hypothetical protein ENI29_18500 [bacterium]|nr:hypothetical protein [bacterium]